MISLLSFFEDVRAKSSSADGPQDEAKRAAADAVLAQVEPGMTLGLGTGSTVDFFLQALAQRIRDGLQVQGVPTSSQTERRAKKLGIPLLGEGEFRRVKNQLCVDGADRVDLAGRLIKGGGGALLREKLVATHSSQVCILVDPSKLVSVFDSTFPLPVECLDFGVEDTLEKIRRLGCEVTLRESSGGGRLRTDNGNVIADCVFHQIADPVATELRLNAIPGIVEVGIFSDLLDLLVVGFPDGTSLTCSTKELTR